MRGIVAQVHRESYLIADGQHLRSVEVNKERLEGLKGAINLRSRGLDAKRSLASREFALGVEALDSFRSQ